MNLLNVFNNLKNELMNRTGILTEDNIRYYLFSKMYDQDNSLDNYYLELPYDSSLGMPLSGSNFSTLVTNRNGTHQELDLYYDNGNDKFAFEIKFHRPSDTTSGLPNKAGELFNDIKRLELITTANIRKFLVYITDDEMNNYFTIHRGMTNSYLNAYLNSFYTTSVNNNINAAYLAGGTKTNNDGSKTFFDCASKSFINIFNFRTIGSNLKMFFTDDFVCTSPSINARNPNGLLHIRVIEVL